MEALVSAGALAAEALNLGTYIGRNSSRYEADIITIRGNPLEAIRAVNRVVFAMNGGRVYKNEIRAANN